MFKFHDHIQINLSQDTVCGEPLDSIILRQSAATSLTEGPVRDCKRRLTTELEEWEHAYNQYLDCLNVDHDK